MNYTNIDLSKSAKKAYADIATYASELGNLANNMKSQQKLKLLNYQVILEGLMQLKGLNNTLDIKVEKLLTSVNDVLEVKKTPIVKIFSLHILFFVALFFLSIQMNPQSANIGYALSSVGMGCATGVLQLMLRRERLKYNINNIFFILDEDGIDKLFDLHKELANIINDFREDDKIDDVDALDKVLKKTIKKHLK